MDFQAAYSQSIYVMPTQHIAQKKHESFKYLTESNGMDVT